MLRSSDEQELKRTGLAAQELQALSRALFLLEAEMRKRHLLGDELLQQTIQAALQIVQRIIVLYSKYITQSKITSADVVKVVSLLFENTDSTYLHVLGSVTNGASKAYKFFNGQNKIIADELIELVTEISKDKEIAKILNTALQAIFQAVAWRKVLANRYVSLMFNTDLNDDLRAEAEQSVYDALLSFVNGVKGGDFPAIVLSTNKKSLLDVFKMTWSQIISTFIPGLDAKPFEKAFPLLMNGKQEGEKKAEDLKQETNKEIWQFWELLDTFTEPLNALGNLWYHFGHSLIKSGYDLELMPDSITHLPEPGMPGKIYISYDGTYIVCDSDAPPREGSLSGFDIDFWNLDEAIYNKSVKKRILNYIQNEGHITLKNELLPVVAIEVMKALLELYASLEAAILSKDNAFLLKFIPKKFKQHYLQAIPEFRKIMEAQLKAWESARDEQIQNLRFAAEKEVKEVSRFAEVINAERNEFIPVTTLPLKTQMQELKAKYEQLRKYEDQFEALKKEMKSSIIAAQSALPGITIPWQMFKPPNVQLMPEEETFVPYIKVDFRQEFQSLYGEFLRERTSSDYLSLKCETDLVLPEWFSSLHEKYYTEFHIRFDKHQELISEAKNVLHSLVSETEKQLSVKIDVDDPRTAFADIQSRIAFCISLQRDGALRYSKALQAEFTMLTPEECDSLAKDAVDRLSLPEHLKLLDQLKKKVQRFLIHKAKSSTKDYVAGIQREVTARTATLNTTEDLSLEEALQRSIADSERTESILKWLNDLKRQMESELRSILLQFSPALNNELVEGLIKQSVQSIEIGQFIELLRKRELQLQQYIFSTRMEVLRKNGNIQTLAAEYKSILTEMEALTLREEQLSVDLKAATENLRALEQRSIESNLLLMEIMSEISKFMAQDLKVLKELDLQNILLSKMHEQDLEAERHLQFLKQEDEREEKELLGSLTSLYELNSKIEAYTGLPTPKHKKFKLYLRKRAKVVPADEKTMIEGESLELRQLQLKKQEMVRAIAQLKNNKKTRSREIANIQQEKSDRVRQESASTRQLEELDTQHKYLAESIAKNEVAVSRLKADIATLKANERLESLRSSKLVLEHSLDGIEVERASLSQRKQASQSQIVRLCENQNKLQVERLKAFLPTVKGLIESLKKALDSVMDSKILGGQPFSKQMSYVFTQLNSQNIFAQREQAYALISQIQDTLQTCRKLKDQLSDMAGLFDVSDLSRQLNESCQAAEASQADLESALQQYNLCEEVQHWIDLALDDLYTTQCSIEAEQKSWKVECADKQRLFQVALETALSAELTTFDQTLPKMAEAIKKANEARAAAMATLPCFTTSSWTAALREVDLSLNGIASQNRESQNVVRQIKDRVAEKALERDSLVHEEKRLENQREEAIQSLSSGTAEILDRLEVQCQTKLETLKAAESSLKTRRALLSKAMSDLTSSLLLEPEARMRGLENLLTLIFNFNDPIHYTPWNSEQRDQIQESLTQAEPLQAERVHKTQETIRQIHLLQRELGNSQASLAQETIESIQAASGFYGVICDDLSRIEQEAARELEQFKTRRDQQNKIRDRLEWIAVGFLYVLTLTFVDIQTNKAKAHQAIHSITSAFKAYVSSVQQSKSTLLSNFSSNLATNRCLHSVLIGSIKSAEILFPQESEPSEGVPILPRVSLLRFFNRGPKRCSYALKNVKDLANQYSPDNITLMRPRSSPA